MRLDRSLRWTLLVLLNCHSLLFWALAGTLLGNCPDWYIFSQTMGSESRQFLEWPWQHKPTGLTSTSYESSHSFQLALYSFYIYLIFSCHATTDCDYSYAPIWRLQNLLVTYSWLRLHPGILAGDLRSSRLCLCLYGALNCACGWASSKYFWISTRSGPHPSLSSWRPQRRSREMKECFRALSQQFLLFQLMIQSGSQLNLNCSGLGMNLCSWSGSLYCAMIISFGGPWSI